MSVFGCDSSGFSRIKISANCCQNPNFVNVYPRERHPTHGNQESAKNGLRITLVLSPIDWRLAKFVALVKIFPGDAIAIYFELRRLGPYAKIPSQFRQGTTCTRR